MENNVSVAKIQEGIDYLESKFMKPLVDVGQELIDDYTMFNQSIKSDSIDASISKQQKKLDDIQNELASICNKAKGQMEDSSNIISQNQAIIDSELENI